MLQSDVIAAPKRKGAIEPAIIAQSLSEGSNFLKEVPSIAVLLDHQVPSAEGSGDVRQHRRRRLRVAAVGVLLVHEMKREESNNYDACNSHTHIMGAAVLNPG